MLVILFPWPSFFPIISPLLQSFSNSSQWLVLWCYCLSTLTSKSELFLSGVLSIVLPSHAFMSFHSPRSFHLSTGPSPRFCNHVFPSDQNTAVSHFSYILSHPFSLLMTSSPKLWGIILWFHWLVKLMISNLNRNFKAAKNNLLMAGPPLCIFSDILLFV